MALNLPQADKIFIAQQKLLYLQQDFIEFNNFNPVRFTQQFLIDYQAAIIAARDFISDEAIIYEGTSLTQTVQDRLKDAQKLYKIIKYFVEDAFANDIGVQNKFGLDNYKAIRINPTEMVLFLSNLYAQARTYQAQLTAKGLNISKIIEIEILRNDLYTAVNQQTIFTGERMSTTQMRKELYEKMDSFTQETCRAGKLIYEEIDDAKFQNYTIYQYQTSNNTSQVHNISANSTEVAISEGIDSTKGIRFENKGTTHLEIYIMASLQDTPTQIRVVQPNEIVIVPTTTLSNGSYNVLIVRNNNNKAGKYEVEILEQLE